MAGKETIKVLKIEPYQQSHGYIQLKTQYLPVPAIAAVIDPLPHHSVVGIQIYGHVFLFRVQHVAKLLQTTVF